MSNDTNSNPLPVLPGLRMTITGASGIVAGLCLAGELSSFLLSGWSAEKFSDPAQAIEVLQSGGQFLKLASLLGFVGLATTLLLTAGIAARLWAAAPTRSAALLLFTLVGVAGHALVPLSLWIAVPALGALGSASPETAQGSWTAFNLIIGGAQQVGSFFVGFAMICGGSALVKCGSRLVGWIAIGAGLLTLVGVLGLGLGALALASATFLPALVSTILFRFLAGLSLLRASQVDGFAAGMAGPQI